MNTVVANQTNSALSRAIYRNYALALLLLVGVCSWSDRQLLSIVLESLRKEFHFTDTQLGLLGGTAFGLFYVAVGLPIAWLADRMNRRNIIAISIFLWSLLTALTAGATGYGSLFLCRMGVGIGEAGGSAPSQSLVSDLYPPGRRAMAMSILYAYVPIGYLLSYSLGGWINDSMGWRMAFIAFGIPGILLSLLVRLTIREPRRGASDYSTTEPCAAANKSLAHVVRSLLALKAMRHVCLGGALHGLGMFAVAVWLPAYFIRVHSVSSSVVGARLALIMGVGGLIGTLAGGRVADRIVARTRNPGWYVWTCAIALTVSVPLSITLYLTSNANGAFLLLIVPMVLNNSILGPVVASIQGLVGTTRRAVAAAVYLFLVNLVSAGFGPLLVGAISDTLRVKYGSSSLQLALLLVVPVTAAWAALHFYLAGRTMGREFPPLPSAPHRSENIP